MPDLVVSGSAIFDGRDAAGNLTAMLTALRAQPAVATAVRSGGTE